MKRLIYSILAIVLFLGFSTSCSEDDLDPSLEQNKSLESVSNQADLKGLVNGIMNKMQSQYYYGRDFVIFGEIMADNTYANGSSGRFLEPSEMTFGISDAYPRDTWTQIYDVIASANLVLSKDPSEIEGDEAQIKNFMGQALTIRALAHFDLLKFFGQQHVDGSNLGIPYNTSYTGFLSEFSEEDYHPARLTVSEVKEKLYKDLNNAIDYFPGGNTDVFYPTQYAAKAIKSRIALYFGDYTKAKNAAEDVVNSRAYEIVPEEKYPGYWLSGKGPNSILELKNTSTDNAGINGLAYMYKGNSYGDVEVNEDFAAVFDSSDVRLTGETEVAGVTVNMIGGGAQRPDFLYNNGKFPDIIDFADNFPLVRYEEVVLNYAESLLETGNQGKALTWLNKIPNKRGVSPYSSVNKDSILLERRKELAFEGFRYHDLLRNDRNIPANGSYANSHSELSYGNWKLAFPIPETEMESNKNITQNEGY